MTKRGAEQHRLRARQSESERRIRSAVRRLPGATVLESMNTYPGIQVLPWSGDVDEVVDYLNACQPQAIRALLAELNRLRRMLP